MNAVHRVRAIALRVARQRLRGRLVWWTLAMVAAIWAASGEMLASPRSLASLITAAAVLVTVFLVAGAVADDLDSGALLLDLLASARPIELTSGTALGVMASLAPALAVLVAVSAPPLIRSVGVGTASLLIGSALLLAVGWVTLGACLGAVFPSKGNAAVLAVLFLVAAVRADRLPLDSLPSWVAGGVRGLWNALPLVSHVQQWRDAILDAKPWPPVPVAVLILSPLVWLGLGALVLSWRAHRGQGDS